MDSNLWISLAILSIICVAHGNVTVLYAINLGGDAIQGSDGVQYKADLGGHRKFKFRRVGGVNYQDELIYRTAFWDTRLNLNLPTAGKGNYTLILKSEGDLDDRPMMVALNDHLVLWNYKVTATAGFYVGKDVMLTFRLQNGKVYHYELDQEFSFDGMKPWSLQVTGRDNRRVLLSAVVWNHSPFVTNDTSSQPAVAKDVQRDELQMCTCERSTDGSTKKALDDIVKLFNAKEVEYKMSLQALADEFDGIKKAFAQQSKKNETMDCEAMLSDEFEKYSRTLSNTLENH